MKRTVLLAAVSALACNNGPTPQCRTKLVDPRSSQVVGCADGAVRVDTLENVVLCCAERAH